MVTLRAKRHAAVVGKVLEEVSRPAGRKTLILVAELLVAGRIGGLVFSAVTTTSRGIHEGLEDFVLH